MNRSALCDSNKALGLEVRDFIRNVPDAKEESITDYLVWKWRLLDSRFKYINTKTFTRQEESTTTGADFELELWLVGRARCIPLLFQAKKFNKTFDCYVNKLNYPGNTQAQLQTLLAYAASRALLPFYAIYTATASAHPLCRGIADLDSGVYMIDASTIKTFADGVHGRKVSLGSIISRSNPFHCMFCCPMGVDDHYFSEYFNAQATGLAGRSRESLPTYASQILSAQATLADNGALEEQQIDGELPPVRVIGVYDLTREG
jgi:hypothetical protein